LLPLDGLAVDDYLECRGNIMATMISEVYDAFIASGAPEDKAREAAEAMVAYEGRFNKIEGDLNLLKWMNGLPGRSASGYFSSSSCISRLIRLSPPAAVLSSA
jgi:hypothetical protein